MRSYTQDELDTLIALSKEITEPPRREWAEQLGHLRNGMRLKSEDETKQFSVFIRVNKEFHENFSIGLIYSPQEGGRDIPLLRYNGPHGEFNRGVHPHTHFQYHVHRVDAELLNAERDPMAKAAETSTYASCEEAIIHFCRTVRIKDFEQHFPTSWQLSFLEPSGEEGT